MFPFIFFKLTELQSPTNQSSFHLITFFSFLFPHFIIMTFDFPGCFCFSARLQQMLSKVNPEGTSLYYITTGKSDQKQVLTLLLKLRQGKSRAVNWIQTLFAFWSFIKRVWKKPESSRNEPNITVALWTELWDIRRHFDVSVPSLTLPANVWRAPTALHHRKWL